MKQLLYLLLFISFLHSKEQDYSIIVEGPFDDTLFSIIEDYDREISAVGFSQHFSTSTSSKGKTYHSAFDYLKDHHSAPGEQMRLLRFNNAGETTLDYSTQLSKFNQAVSVVKTPDNGYFIGGYTQDGQLLLVRVSSGGETMYIKEFGTRTYDRMNKLVPLRDGGVLSIGSSTTSRNTMDPMFEQGLGLNDIYLTRFDKYGKKLWGHKYGTTHDDRGIDATEAQDGSILVLGTTAEGKSKTISLMRINENGDRIWLKRYKYVGVYNAYRIITLHSGDFLVSITKYNDKSQEEIILVKFDLQQNVLAENHIEGDKTSILFDIKEGVDGSIIGVGLTTETMFGNTDALAIYFDPNLNKIWERFYGDTKRELFYAVDILWDGKFAACGSITQKGTQITNMWVTKLNSDGTFASKSHISDSLYQTLYSVFKKEIDANEITLLKDLTLTIKSPQLQFEQGKYLLTPEQKTFLTHFSKKFLSALKPFQKQIKELEINGYTSSEWKDTDFEQGYLKNTNLSTQRAFSVLSYIFTLPDSKPFRKWLTQVFSNDGNSYAKLIKTTHGTEDARKSRRVEFKLVL